jgi:predicted nucleic acid-binding protein
LSNRVVYADSSALVKLIVVEPETESLRRELSDEPVLVSSTLAHVEVRRAIRIHTRGNRDADSEARRLLAACRLVEVSRPVLDLAADLASHALRSLDAIHLASALRVEPDVVVAYDDRLAEAAVAARLSVIAPGRPGV